MCDPITFDQAMADAGDRPKQVILGNGFSMAQGGGQFGYANLLERSGLAAGDAIRAVFAEFDTVDFEVVVHAFEHAARVEAAYGHQERAETFNAAAVQVRDALIEAVRRVHPLIQQDIPVQQLAACSVFLDQFDFIYSLNYDLMLYWAMLNGSRHRDGFGLGEEAGGYRTFSAEAHCSVLYLHGALHLFDFGGQTRKRMANGAPIIDSVATAIRTSRQLPLFVAEGTSAQKLTRIARTPYLQRAYESLSALEGALFVYGHSADLNDRHIYDAVLRSEIDKLYFCVHNPADSLLAIREKVAPFQARRPDLGVHFVDASTARIWRH